MEGRSAGDPASYEPLPEEQVRRSETAYNFASWEHRLTHHLHLPELATWIPRFNLRLRFRAVAVR